MAMDMKETKMKVERNVEGGNLLVEAVMEERRTKRRKTRRVQRTMATKKCYTMLCRMQVSSFLGHYIH